MEDIRVSFQQVAIYITLINIVLGFLLGTFPLLSGIKTNNRKYGIYGFIGAIIGGAILGIFLSYPIAAFFNWLILKKSVAEENNAAPVVNKDFVEAVVENTENR